MRIIFDNTLYIPYLSTTTLLSPPIHASAHRALTISPFAFSWKRSCSDHTIMPGCVINHAKLLDFITALITVNIQQLHNHIIVIATCSGSSLASMRAMAPGKRRCTSARASWCAKERCHQKVMHSYADASYKYSLHQIYVVQAPISSLLIARTSVRLLRPRTSIHSISLGWVSGQHINIILYIYI